MNGATDKMEPAATNDRTPGTTNSVDCPNPGRAAQAINIIAGEEPVRAYLARVRAGIALPGELCALLASLLHDDALRGALRLIEKALEGLHHE